jgi:hypothetical protein
MERLRQEAQQSWGELESRIAGGFPQFEHKLPARWPPSASVLLRTVSTVLRRRNPLVQPADPEQHIVWLFDNVAYRATQPEASGPQPWHAEVVCSVFVKGSRDVGKHVAAVADAIGLDGKAGKDPVVRRRMEERLYPFLYRVAPARIVNLELPSKDGPGQKHQLGPTNGDGILSQILQPSVGLEVADGSVIRPYLPGWDRKVSMNMTFADSDGWLIISDIDDSIKYTQTSEAVGILRTTFAEEPKPIEGMPDFYRHIQTQLRPAWVYLSASPYNLYPFLHEFLRTHYPLGTMILRENSWHDLGGFLRSYSMGAQAYKMDRMDKVHRWFPQRRVVCVGDSTHSDPEAYAGIYTKYPGWVHAIYIRKVTNIPKMEQKNSDERFEKAFEDVPRNVWTVFEQPSDLYHLIDGLKVSGTVISDNRTLCRDRG